MTHFGIFLHALSGAVIESLLPPDPIRLLGLLNITHLRSLAKKVINECFYIIICLICHASSISKVIRFHEKTLKSCDGK